VIDFYKGADKISPSGSASPISIFLDVRPALDSFSAVIDRLYVGAAEVVGFPALPLPKAPNNAPSSHLKGHLSRSTSTTTTEKK